MDDFGPIWQAFMDGEYIKHAAVEGDALVQENDGAAAGESEPRTKNPSREQIVNAFFFAIELPRLFDTWTPEDLAHIFERFYRADGGRSREAGGTGLGLAIVKHLVQAQGGQVGVESGRGGSRFWVRLPVAT